MTRRLYGWLAIGETRKRQKSGLSVRAAAGLALAFVGLLVAAAPGFADPRYAAPDGDGPSGSCPRTDPCDLQTAVEDVSVQDGDLVNLLPGTFTLSPGENVDATDEITIQGEPGGARPTIEGGTAFLFLLFMEDGGTLRDFRIVADDMSGGAVIGQTVGGLIERVEAVATGTTGSAFHITNVLIRDSVGTVASNSGAALELNPTAGSLDARNLTLIGFGNGSRGAYIQAESTVSASTQTVTIRNSIVRGGEEGIFVRDIDGNQGDDDVSVSVSFSNYSSATTLGPDASLTLGSGNQKGSPAFVDAGHGDFRETAASRTVDAGSPDSLTGSRDFLGGARQLGDAIDIGADELLPRCAGRAATVAGTPVGETLKGTPGVDVVAAGGGGDQIRSRGGRDLVCAGDGNDVVFAGAGADRVRGEAGADVLRGERGRDHLLGGPGRDRLFGGGGLDWLRGGAGRDLQFQ